MHATCWRSSAGFDPVATRPYATQLLADSGAEVGYGDDETDEFRGTEGVN